MNLFNKYFSFKKPDEMLQDLFYSKSKSDNRDKLVLIYENFDYITGKATQTRSDTNKSKLVKILDIIRKILDFNEKNQQGQVLNILTPNEMLSRLLITLLQLKAEKNSEKLKNKIRQLLYSLYRSKTLTKTSIKVWLTLFKAWKQFLWTAKIVKQLNLTDLDWI